EVKLRKGPPAGGALLLRVQLQSYLRRQYGHIDPTALEGFLLYGERARTKRDIRETRSPIVARATRSLRCWIFRRIGRDCKRHRTVFDVRNQRTTRHRSRGRWTLHRHLKAR